MILDTSALAAIFFGEPEAALYTQLIHDADRCRMSAAIFLELSIVIEGQIGTDAGRQCDVFFRRADIISSLSPSSRRISRARPSLTSARAATRPGSISATALPMRSRRSPASLSSSRGRISKRPTSYLLSERQAPRKSFSVMQRPIQFHGFAPVSKHSPGFDGCGGTAGQSITRRGPNSSSAWSPTRSCGRSKECFGSGFCYQSTLPTAESHWRKKGNLLDSC